jgi:hypothetical protein
VGFVVGAGGVAGVDLDRSGQGCGVVERDDTDGVGEQLGWTSRTCWSGLTWARGRGVGAA